VPFCYGLRSVYAQNDLHVHSCAVLCGNLHCRQVAPARVAVPNIDDVDLDALSDSSADADTAATDAVAVNNKVPDSKATKTVVIASKDGDIAEQVDISGNRKGDVVKVTSPVQPSLSSQTHSRSKSAALTEDSASSRSRDTSSGVTTSSRTDSGGADNSNGHSDGTGEAGHSRSLSQGTGDQKESKQAGNTGVAGALKRGARSPRNRQPMRTLSPALTGQQYLSPQMAARQADLNDIADASVSAATAAAAVKPAADTGTSPPAVVARVPSSSTVTVTAVNSTASTNTAAPAPSKLASLDTALSPSSAAAPAMSITPGGHTVASSSPSTRSSVVHEAVAVMRLSLVSSALAIAKSLCLTVSLGPLRDHELNACAVCSRSPGRYQESISYSLLDVHAYSAAGVAVPHGL